MVFRRQNDVFYGAIPASNSTRARGSTLGVFGKEILSDIGWKLAFFEETYRYNFLYFVK